MDSRLLGNDIEKELRLPHPDKSGFAMTITPTLVLPPQGGGEK